MTFRDGIRGENLCREWQRLIAQGYEQFHAARLVEQLLANVEIGRKGRPVSEKDIWHAKGQRPSELLVKFTGIKATHRNMLDNRVTPSADVTNQVENISSSPAA